MGLVEIIFSTVNQLNIITGEIHVQGNVGMMSRIIIEKGHEKPDHINDAEQKKQKPINVLRKKRLPHKTSLRKITNYVATLLTGPPPFVQ